MGKRAVRLRDSGPLRDTVVWVGASALTLGVLLYGHTQGLVVWRGPEAALWGGLHVLSVAAMALAIHRGISMGGPGATLTVLPAVAIPGEAIEVHWAIESEGIDISGIDLDLVEARETIAQGERQSERDVRKTRIGPAEGDEDLAMGGVSAELPDKLTLDLHSRDQRLVWYIELRVRYTQDGTKRKRITRRFRVPFEDRL